MNSSFLGDALDHWKGALFSFLLQEDALDDLVADPMLTDPEAWKPDDFRLYARLLNLPGDRVLAHSRSLRDRAAYFREIGHAGDIFLDPDVGIATHRVRRREQYVEVVDVIRLLFSGQGRMVVVYQHVRGKTVADRVDRVVSKFPADLFWVSYESGTVAMLFISLAPWRTERVAGSLRNLLGRHAEHRIRGTPGR